MFNPQKIKKSAIPLEHLPEQMQSELWHIIFMRQHKGLMLTSPQRFNFFKNPHEKTLTVVHSQAEPYFSDSFTAPYAAVYDTVDFPTRIFVYEKEDCLLMTTQEE